MGIMLSDLLSISDCAAHFGVSDSTVQNWIDAQLLPAVRVGRSLVISLWELETFTPPAHGRPAGRSPQWSRRDSFKAAWRTGTP